MSKYPSIRVASCEVKATRLCFWAQSLEDLKCLAGQAAPFVIVLDFELSTSIAENEILSALQQNGASLFLNASARIAHDLKADGVVVQDFETLDEALKYKKLFVLYGPAKSRDEAMEAAEKGADAVMFHGPQMYEKQFPKSLDLALWWNENIETRGVLFVPSAEVFATLDVELLDYIALKNA